MQFIKRLEMSSVLQIIFLPGLFKPKAYNLFILDKKLERGFCQITISSWFLPNLQRLKMNFQFFILCFLTLYNFGKCDEFDFEEKLFSAENLNFIERSKLLNLFSNQNYASLLESLDFDGISEKCRNGSQAIANRLKVPSTDLTTGYWHLKSKSLFFNYYYYC